MDEAAAVLALRGGDLEEAAEAGVAGEEEAGFLEGLADGGQAVEVAVLVAGGEGGAGRVAVVEGGDVAAGEDVGAGEGAGLLDALQEEDLVVGGDEEDAG